MNERTLRMVWPIADPSTPFNQLVAQANRELAALVRADDLRPAGPPVWHLGRRSSRIVWVAEMPVHEGQVRP
jgi:hypothetical protein